MKKEQDGKEKSMQMHAMENFDTVGRNKSKFTNNDDNSHKWTKCFVIKYIDHQNCIFKNLIICCLQDV